MMNDLKCYRCDSWPCECSDGCAVLWGDCREVINASWTFDAVITDPPYGINHSSHGMLFRKAEKCYGDKTIEHFKWLDQITGRKLLVAFFSPYKIPPISWRNVLCWYKGGHVGIGGDRRTCWKRTFELIGVKGNGPLIGTRDDAVLEFNAVSPPPSGHFCEKPIAILDYLIFKTDADNILDPFMGSGTTLVAAKQLGRKAIGIEIEERYCEIAANRLANEPMPLFREAVEI